MNTDEHRKDKTMESGFLRVHAPCPTPGTKTLIALVFLCSSVCICVPGLLSPSLRRWLRGTTHFRARPEAEAIEVEVDDRRRVEGEELAHEQAADDRNAERAAQLRAVAEADRERDRA